MDIEKTKDYIILTCYESHDEIKQVIAWQFENRILINKLVLKGDDPLLYDRLLQLIQNNWIVTYDNDNYVNDLLKKIVDLKHYNLYGRLFDLSDNGDKYLLKASHQLFKTSRFNEEIIGKIQEHFKTIDFCKDDSLELINQAFINYQKSENNNFFGWLWIISLVIIVIVVLFYGL